PPSSSTLSPYTTLFRSPRRHPAPILLLLHDVLAVDLRVRPVRGAPLYRRGAPLRTERDRISVRLLRIFRIGHPGRIAGPHGQARSEEHTSELQSRENLV